MSNVKITIKVKYFASAREITGIQSETISINDSSKVSDLVNLLIHKYPNSSERFKHFLFAVNQEYADLSQSIMDNDELAVFPPVSGGNGDVPTIALICEDEPDLNKLVKEIQDPSTGAAVIFNGFVRGQSPGSAHPKTDRLDYEAYQPMAEKVMLQIADEMRIKWPAIHGIFMVQRIGTLEPEEMTIAIGVTTGHRTEGCFEAARYGIDRMKEIVPVWKKENGPDGEEWVEGSFHPQI